MKKVDMRKEIAARIHRALLAQGIQIMGKWKVTDDKKGIVDPSGKKYVIKEGQE